MQSSRLVAPSDHHNTTGQVDPIFHGNGPVEISITGFPTTVDARVVNTTKVLPAEFPFNVDYQSGNSTGISESSDLVAGHACKNGIC